jgi:hypothetical protein
MLRLLPNCLLFVWVAFFSPSASAQTEFPKEFIAHLRLHSGMVSDPGTGSPLFLGGLQVIPQVTLVPGSLRGGLAAGAFYSAKHLEGSVGPTLSLLLKEFKGGFFGSLGNLHLNADHLWGTGGQRLAGGGLNLDLLNKLVVGLSAHRDYRLNNWWIQSGIAFKISKTPVPKETFPN